MYAEERQQAIAAWVTRQGRASVADLAESFNVTTETVRRDLSALERMNLLRRVHGGAVPARSLTVVEIGLIERVTENSEAKERIARKALDLLPRDGSVILDAGSTTARLAGMLPPDLHLTVFTHAVPIAATLAPQGQIELHLLPGRVRPTTHAAVGASTVAALGKLRADVGLLGANGLSTGHGFSTPDAEEAATKTAILNSCERVVALVDSSKLGLELTCRFAELDQVDTLITDEGIAESDVATLERAGVEVLIA